MRYIKLCVITRINEKESSIKQMYKLTNGRTKGGGKNEYGLYKTRVMMLESLEDHGKIISSERSIYLLKNKIRKFEIRNSQGNIYFLVF